MLKRLLPALVAITALVPTAVAVSGSPPPSQPLLPDLDQEMPTQLIVTKAQSGWRLGFRSAVRNIGAGPLIIDGHRLAPQQKFMDAEQVIVGAGGERSVIDKVGRLRYVRSPDHQHWHLLRFDRYELRRPSGTAVVRDRKSGFCLGDRYTVTTRVLPARPPEPAYTTNCGLERPGLMAVREGMSVGYGDDYKANLEGQYLPLKGLRNGRYTLVHVVNGDHRLREVSYDNNAASTLLRLRWRHGVPRITVLAVCPTTAQCTAAR